MSLCTQKSTQYKPGKLDTAKGRQRQNTWRHRHGIPTAQETTQDHCDHLHQIKPLHSQGNNDHWRKPGNQRKSLSSICQTGNQYPEYIKNCRYQTKTKLNHPLNKWANELSGMFWNKNYKTAKKYLEKYSLSSAMRECELKLLWDSIFPPVRGCHQKQIVTNSGKHTEQVEPLDTRARREESTLAQLLGKSVWRLLRQLKRTNYPVTCWSDTHLTHPSSLLSIHYSEKIRQSTCTKLWYTDAKISYSH